MSAAYLRTTRAMRDALAGHGARLEDLAGGCCGVSVPVDGATLILARHPDMGPGSPAEYGTWAAWLEDADGECIAPVAGDPMGAADLGYVRPRDYGTTVRHALQAIRAARATTTEV